MLYTVYHINNYNTLLFVVWFFTSVLNSFNVNPVLIHQIAQYRYMARNKTHVLGKLKTNFCDTLLTGYCSSFDLYLWMKQFAVYCVM